MMGPTSIQRALFVHAAVYVAAALALLAKAQPVDWNTPTNLGAEMGWGFYVVLILIVSGLLGPLEGGFLGSGYRVPGWLFAALAAGVGMSGSAFFLDQPAGYGDEEWVSGSGDVIMSEGLWFAFWLADTAIALAVLALLRRRIDSPVGTRGGESA